MDSTIGKALDEISFEWLNNTHPSLAQSIEDEIKSGAKPADVRRYVMKHTQRHELSLRCEQVARHLKRGS